MMPSHTPILLENVDDIPKFVSTYNIKGFLDHEEGAALHDYALRFTRSLPALEVGSYCGLSALYLGLAARKNNATLYAVDHHCGSEEHQLGQYYHDSDLYDAALKAMNSFPFFRRTVDIANLNDTVVPIICSSALACRDWQTPLGFVFIDGGHSEAMSRADCLQWSERIASGGLLAIHDIFEKPENGGQGPYLAMQAVLSTGDFEIEDRVKSLVLLRKR